MPGQLAQGSQPSAQGAAGASLNEATNLGGQGFTYAGAHALLLAQAETGITAGTAASAAAIRRLSSSRQDIFRASSLRCVASVAFKHSASAIFL
jgi:hypothetical protein